MRRRLALTILVALVLLVAAGCALAPPGHPQGYYPNVERAAYWEAMGRCEQPGDGWAGVEWTVHGPTYEGGLGFYSGTWDQWRAGDFTDNAGDATPAMQMIVGDRIYDDVGPSAWGCSKTVGTRP